MSEPEGRGAAWTEERGTSDEGRRRPKSAPEASGEQSTSDEARRRLKAPRRGSGEQSTSDEGRQRSEGGMGRRAGPRRRAEDTASALESVIFAGLPRTSGTLWSAGREGPPGLPATGCQPERTRT